MQHVPKHDHDGRQQREEEFSGIRDDKRKKKLKLAIISSIIIVTIIAAISYAIFSPGKYDEFAKCLTEKGAVMYGEDWCHNTQGQKAMFGKSFKYINYQVKPDLEIRPTWVIDGKSYQTVQSFQRLSALTGCKFN